MYHFVAEEAPELRLSNNNKAQVSSQITQYLKCFQIEAIRYLFNFLVEKREFCIYNDESGLGKCAAIVALLDATAANKKTLIVVQNDDHIVCGWEFHFSVLTNMSIRVIQNGDDTTESEHSIYLAKWSVLRSIGDLSKLKFDYIIIDNRGQTLNNSFCTSMLLQHFEMRVNIVISSLDITADVKLLHNVLRLGGCLDPKYKNYSSFEKKFRLPQAKDVFSKKVDLEEYYKKRELLGNNIKNFRLRRYRHQYDQYLPLVTAENYNTNLTVWLASQNNSGTTLTDSSNVTSVDFRSTAGTEEIIECLIRLKHEREAAEQIHDTVELNESSEPSDEPIVMSPLFFSVSESESETEKLPPIVTVVQTETDDVVLLSSEECEIVPTTTTSNSIKKVRQNSAKQVFNDPKQNTHSTGCVTAKKSSKQSDKITARTKSKRKAEVLNETPKRKTRKVETPTAATTENSIKSKPQTIESTSNDDMKTPPPTRRSAVTRKSTQSTPRRSTARHTSLRTPNSHDYRETRSMNRITRSAQSRLQNKYMQRSLALEIDKKRKSKVRSKQKVNKETQNKKYSIVAVTASAAESKQNKETKIIDKTENANPDKIPTAAVPKRNKQKKKQTKDEAKDKNKTKKQIPKKSTIRKMSQPAIMSSAESDLDDMQCGQEFVFDYTSPNNDPVVPTTTSTTHFLIPATPLSSAMLPFPSTSEFFNESDIAILNAQNPQEIVVLSSSQDESESHSTQSRRTRALKRKRTSTSTQQQLLQQQTTVSKSTMPSFGELLAKQAQERNANKSPDLFSNCSDLAMLELTPQQQQLNNNKNTFDGFKIFGSEVKQFQQQHAKTATTVSNLGNNSPKKRRERSCLELLEKMFEPKTKKLPKTQNPTSSCLNKNVNPPDKTNTKSPMTIIPYPIELPKTTLTHEINNAQRGRTIIEDDDEFFEITNNGTFGSVLRLNSDGDISPVQQQQTQTAKSTQNNKITNYLIGGVGGSTTQTEDETTTTTIGTTSTPSRRLSLSGTAPPLRKSPKSTKLTQVTKLTRWFGAINAETTTPTSTPPTIELESSSASEITNTRLRGPSKRKCLDVFKF